MKSIRKHIFAIVLAVIVLQTMFGGAALADDNSYPGFHVMVSSTAGEINFRAGAGTVYNVIGWVPNGTVLYISDLAYNMRDQFLYGKTAYAGQNGWVSLRQTVILRSNGYQAPDFYATVRADAGSINFRTGAGMGYPVITNIPNGLQLHIVDLVYNPGDGFFWGCTYYDGVYGYVSIRQTNIRRDYDMTPEPYIPQAPAPNPTPVPAPAPEPTPAPTPEPVVPINSDNVGTSPSSWKDLYIEYIENQENLKEIWDGNVNNDAVIGLGYIDNDDIPELVIDYYATFKAGAAGFAEILWIDKGELKKRTGWPQYIEKTGVMYIDDGYRTQENYIAQLVDGECKISFSAVSNGWTDPATYTINGNDVSYTTYSEQLEKSFTTPSKAARKPDYYNIDSISRLAEVLNNY